MGTAATRFEDLGVWQKAHPFVRKVYRLTRTFPAPQSMAGRLGNGVGRVTPRGVGDCWKPILVPF